MARLIFELMFEVSAAALFIVGIAAIVGPLTGAF